MKYIQLATLQKVREKSLPYLIVLFVLLFAGGVAFSFSPQSAMRSDQSERYVQATTQNTKKPVVNTQAPTTIANKDKNVLGTRTVTPAPTSKTAASGENNKENNTAAAQSGISVNTSSNNSQQSGTPVGQGGQSTPTSTTVPQNPTTAPTAVVSTVTVEVKIPDAPASFSVELKDGMNVCDVLQKAKDTGKINSLSFDDSYLSAYHSRYVSEINGYRNNWTFSINGNSPLGCSLANPKPNDTIVWKFG